MAAVITQQGGQLFAGDVVRTEIWTYCMGQVGMCGLSFKVQGATGTLPTFGAMAKQLADGLVTVSIRKLWSTDVNFMGVKVRDIGNPVKKLSGIATLNVPGITLGAVMPGQVSGIISWKTLFTGQKYRGRSYMPFPPDSCFDLNIPGPTAGYLNDMDGVANYWMNVQIIGTAPNSADVISILYHPAYTDDLGVFHPATYDPIKSWASPQRFATQRRRGEYGALNPPVITG